MRIGILWMLLLLPFGAVTQTVQTIVPKTPVVVGTAFQVQYVITQPDELTNIAPPEFTGFTLVSGPNRYRGNAVIEGRQQPIVNVAYTLVPKEAGSQIVRGLRADFRNGAAQQAPEASVLVSHPPRASFNAVSSYTDVSLLQATTPAERERLVREHLWIRVIVDRRSCYVGQPVLATFKLYSRLQSTSELERAPSLYGFSVVDVLDINRSHGEVERIDGQVVNTYTLRKVLLYPGQSGRLTIDEMVVQNSIEFPDSGGVHLLRRQLKTEAVNIEVKPLPLPQPENYEGAVGRFRLAARWERPAVAVNGQGRLLVELSGRGNFIQLTPPRIPWPAKMEVFEPEITDSIRLDSLATGLRRFVFGFSVPDTGALLLPPITLVFFDPSLGRYDSVRTASLPLSVTLSKGGNREGKQRQPGTGSALPWIIAAVLTLGVLLGWSLQKRRRRPTAPVSPPVRPDAAQELEELQLSRMTAQEACTEIRRILQRVKQERVLSAQQVAAIRAVEEECALLAFTSLKEEGRVEELRRSAVDAVK